MPRFRKTTLKEVAARAGVSMSTVSLFVSGKESVCSRVTADRIRRAVSDLQYTPNSLVLGMQTNIREAVGVCVASHWDKEIKYGSFFFERIWHGIFEQADLAKYSILRYAADIRYSDRCDKFLDGRVDGLLMHAHTHDNQRAALVAAAGMPIVLVTRSINIPDGCGAAYIDEASVVQVALERLWCLGHRRIAHLAGPVDVTFTADPEDIDDIAIERKQAYEEWMRARFSYDSSLLHFVSSWNQPDVGSQMNALFALENRPTAILCANDCIAVKALEMAWEFGWRVPDEISIVGIDNSDDPLALKYDLTTVDPHIDRVGRDGMVCLLNIIHGGLPANSRQAISGADWIERGTVGVRPVDPRKG
jgi:DNA-binding LacI/PurR family transcriptional regulator